MLKPCVFFVAALLFSVQALQAQSSSGLSIEESQQRRLAFINASMEYYGTPYAAGGTSKSGIDCSGLIWRSGLEGPGLSLPRTAIALSEYAQRIEESELEPGDLLFFNTTGRISHVGIYLGNGNFIHSASDGPQTGVIVSNLSESYWNRTYRFSGRIFPPAGMTDSVIPVPSEAGLFHNESEKENLGLMFELRGTALWDFDYEKNFIRGTTISTTAQWRGRLTYYPGITAGFTWDTHHDTMSVPIYFSVTAQNGLGFFVGTQIIFYSGGDGSTDFFFPGIIGASWTSPYKELGLVKIGFYQSIECVFVPREDVVGKTLDDVFRLSTGVVLAIGK